ncbi:MAG: HD domain-containing protein [Candidatus Goldbacteria bacterium]|nr:HD domain-containing protein [Candidatus Goldiibacteriota bacterium]
MKIKIQFIISVIIIIISTIIATTFLIVKDTKKFLYNNLEEKSRLINNYLIGISAESILKKDELSLSMYIKKIMETPEITYLYITDKNYKIFSSHNIAHIGKDLKIIFPEIINSNNSVYFSKNGIDINTKNIVTPIEIQSKNEKIHVGYIHIGFDKTKIENEIMNIYFKSGIIAIVLIFFATVFIIYITNRITAPLSELIKGIEIVSSGNLKHKIKINVQNEFRMLANSFNDMTEKLNDYYEGIINAFMMALDLKDKYAPGHAKRVAQYSVEIAKKLNLKPRQIENLKIASILKDVGNIGIEQNILSKKDTLSPDELIKIQKHPENSAKILKNIKQLQDVIPIILQHHERYDGLGYPMGLKGEEIAIEARILAVTDAYDAMTTQRTHKDALSMDEAIYELRANKGKQFDPKITEIFIEILNKKTL